MILFTDKRIPLVDSNILIDYFLSSKNTDIATKLIDNSVYLIQPVLVETLNFIKNKSSNFSSFQAAKLILENPQTFNFLPYVPDFVSESLEIMDKYLSAKLAFTDCLLLAHAQYYDLKLFSQDQKMQAFPEASVVNPFE